MTMLEKPKFKKENWDYFDEQAQQWKLKPDAPEWAKKEFEEFMAAVYPEPDEDGKIAYA
jgi:hypothetical protein